MIPIVDHIQYVAPNITDMIYMYILNVKSDVHIRYMVLVYTLEPLSS